MMEDGANLMNRNALCVDNMSPVIIPEEIDKYQRIDLSLLVPRDLKIIRGVELKKRAPIKRKKERKTSFLTRILEFNKNTCYVFTFLIFACIDKAIHM